MPDQCPLLLQYRLESVERRECGEGPQADLVRSARNFILFDEDYDDPRADSICERR